MEWKSDVKEQCYSFGAGANQRELIEKLIDLLDDDGFLAFSLSELESLLKVRQSDLKEALEQLREFEPLGLGCYDESEYLLYRIMQKTGFTHPKLEWLCREGLPQLELRQYGALARQMGMDIERVRMLHDLLLSFGRRPTAEIKTDSEPLFIVPELEIKTAGGSLQVNLLRRLSDYVKVIQYKSGDLAGDYAAVREELSKARMMVASLKRREETILKLGEYIAAKQRDFFLDSADLKRCTKKSAAEALGMHQSTIGRAVNGKYLRCAHGMFPLGFFFRPGPSRDENASSAYSIQEKILRLIKEETLEHPLTDEEICGRLSQTGIEISRRTVAKYRQKYGIGCAYKRKAIISANGAASRN